MSPPRLSWFPLLLLPLALAGPASAQDDPHSRAIAGISSQDFDQVLYKGLVGNVLDAVPMDASDRLQLQRTNAVVSNTFFGRSLAVLAGLSNPVLLLGGFVWGMWAAANIKPLEAGVRLAADPDPSAATPERLVALLAPSAAVDNAAANSVPGSILLSSIFAGGSDATAVSPPRVIKIWLPQRSSMLSR